MWTEKLAAGADAVRQRLPKAGGSLQIVRRFSGTVIGVDASLRGTGIAVLDFSQAHPSLLFSSKIVCQRKLSFFQCIEKIFTEVSAILKNFAVDWAAIEQTIYVQNHRVAHTLGAARGAIIAALMNGGVGISEYAPLRIKQAISGVGRASKEQVRRMVCNILRVESAGSYDESDAIAVAICHAWAGGRCGSSST
ncbi:MAG: crossover junction endodeoxyribonuclease RuvC [Puniceicoccales bacterium]|nr:crossover junction endodeoxyribonuclease RuvC [Puniceicoccales bacterium]